MTNKPTQLTRTCSACGIQKPLSAFMQLGGPSGAGYGLICSTCRSTQSGKAQDTSKEEHSGFTTFGLKIDKNARLRAEIEKNTFIQKQKESTQKETEKREKITTEKLDRQDVTTRADKFHRESYKQQNFLSQLQQNNKAPTLPKQSESTKAFAQSSLLNERQRALETQQRENLQQQESNQATAADLSHTRLESQQATEVEKYGRSFNDFLEWLGPDAPRRRALEMYVRRKPGKTPPPKQNPSTTPTETQEAKDPLEEYAQKQYGPSARKR